MSHQKRQHRRRIRICEINDELDHNLVKRKELRDEETRLTEERRQLQVALIEKGTPA